MSEMNQEKKPNDNEEVNEEIEVRVTPAENEEQAPKADDQQTIDEMIDETEKQSLNELATLKEANNEANEEVIDDAEVEIKKIFADLKAWLKQNSDPEAIKANIEKAKDQTIAVLNGAREKAIEVSNSPEFQQTLEAGKDFLKGTGTLIGEGFKELKDALCQNPSIKKVFDGADEQIEKLRANENLKDAVDHIQDATEKLNNAIFSGINKFFKPKQTPQAPKEIEMKSDEDKDEE